MSDPFAGAPLVLTDGAIETRLIHEFDLPTPDFAAFIHLFTPAGRAALEAIYRGYMRVAVESGLPMQVGTPTWRAHPDALARLGYGNSGELRRINTAAVELLTAIRHAEGAERLVRIAGVIGPRRDGYDPEGAPERGEAEAYHTLQARLLAQLGVDLLYAPTFASAEELVGVARACAATPLPYALAPVVDEAARLLDGSELRAALAEVAAATPHPPAHVLIGCVHPARFVRAAQAPAFPADGSVQGLKANAADLPPEALNALDHLAGDPPERFAAAMAKLHAPAPGRPGLRFLGGCCGTGEAHIRALARQFSAAPA